MPKTEAQVVRSAQTGRFIGMSHSIARVDAVIIPGYRIRG
ncbi:hypothetical protein ADIARSV_0036 [Arcticibacter svalbardensis MN12-7]|uniref:Uncharacterized protein n=2 Tax=Arcticibacter TaxID=1288026 RepID=R9GYP1_9SPHI|nr:hypothetical protein ADIARSV_0036 [Arcticibacter svalbardensis MN12-7]